MAITPEDLQYFGEAVSELLGVDIPTLKQAVTYIQGQQVQSSLQPIRDEWGDKFDENFSAVQAHYETLTEEQKSFYDNPDGLRYLFDKFVAPKMQAAPQTDASSDVPKIATGNTTETKVSAEPTGLTREKINAMDRRTYAENADAITAFYANGGSAPSA